jgi:hypothetical protein
MVLGQRMSLIVLLIVVVGEGPLAGRTTPAGPRVFASFDLSAPERGPFPSDVFTVRAPQHATGRRLAVPTPDCVERPSDCHDLDVINKLDGWGLQPRVSLPFDGAIDPSSVTSDTVFVVGLDSTVPGRPPAGERIGINQAVWDATMNVLHVEVDRLLDQQHRYAVIVTSGVRDVRGRAVKRTKASRASSPRHPHGMRGSFVTRWPPHRPPASLRDTSSPLVCSPRRPSRR